MSTVTAISFKPKATRKRLKKEMLSDDFKKRKIFWKIFRTGKFSMENFPPHITIYSHVLTFLFSASTASLRANRRCGDGFTAFPSHC
jgi:hypothetical protein